MVFTRMPRYDIRNDGAGPYAVFYCEGCEREFRSQPDFGGAVVQDLGRQALGGLLRKVPLVGRAAAESVTGDDPRYSYKMTPAQLESAWKQVQEHFRECPSCQRIVCLSDFDVQSETCNECSPRQEEIAEAQGVQVGAALKGIAGVFGLGEAFKQVGDAARQASAQAEAQLARCPQGHVAPVGTKFCPECGAPMTQPVVDTCSACGAEVHGAKFCPECGTRIERAPASTACPKCGTETKGAKFCPECGAKIG